MQKYFKLMRMHHYIKNLLIFLALFCSGNLFNSTKFISACIGFISFSLITSSIYIINDIKDREKDRNHPTKCKRPIASGEITVEKAIVLAVLLIVLAFLCSITLMSHIIGVILLLTYMVINILYSIGLKNIPIVDVSILASGFLIRIYFGGIITDIEISKWLYLTVMALVFYLVLGKRRNELKTFKEGETRNVLKYYTEEFLNKSMMMFLTLANAFYALWSMETETISRYNSKYLFVSVPIVWLITLKYSMSIEGKSDGDPVEVLLHDKVLIGLCIIYFFVMFGGLYI